MARTAPAPVRATFGADTEPQTAQLLDPKGTPSTNAALDLDLDLDDAPVRAGATTAPAPLPPAAPTPAATMAPAVAAGVAAAATSAAAARISVPPPPPSDSELHAPLDFDLDLDFAPPSELPAAAAAPVAAQPVAPAGKADSGMIDFDMNALSVDPDSRSGGDLKTEQPDDADEDPLGTKLSLAQEFHAIGDTEGARTLVKEVIAESSGALRVRAERFLAELN